jgi:hypothetical protein
LFDGLQAVINHVQALVQRRAAGHLGDEALSLAGVPVHLAAGGPRETGQDATAKDQAEEHQHHEAIRGDQGRHEPFGPAGG